MFPWALRAAQNSSSQASTNSSRSGSVGVSFGAQGFTVDISASKSKGKGDGSETTYSNSHVNAGNTLTLQSGGDTTLQGAVAKAERVVADVGGDLKIESLQDRSQYKEQQSTQGFSLSIPMGPTGAFGASVTASKTNINSNYQSANEQSAIAAGDGGFDVRAKGNTKLIGGAITSTQKAVDDGVNHFKTDGTLTLTDLQNQAQYSASSVGGTLGMGSQLSSSNAGVGQDKGNASSVTTASISGIAGDKDKRSGDAQQGIKPIFDADTVKADVQAQVQITQAFGQNASKAVGDYGAKQLKEATALKQKADLTEDPDERNALLQKANDIESNWKEGGAMRVALHTLVGGLTGGVGGALGAAAASSAAPAIDALQAQLTEGLMKSGLSETASKNLASIVGSLTATGIGAAAGGGAGGATALNSDANNRQLHDVEKKIIKTLAKGDPQKEARLTAAACALVKCYAEFPVGSEVYNYYKAIADWGNSAEIASERNTLQQQQKTLRFADSGYPIKNLFNYSTDGLLSDDKLDASKAFMNTYQVPTRAMGALQAGLGMAGLATTGVAAPAACATGIGCVAAGITGTLSLDAIATGTTQAWNGEPQSTFTNRAIQATGLSPDAANYLEMILGVGAGSKLLSLGATSVVPKVNSTMSTGTKGANGGGKVADAVDDAAVTGRPTPRQSEIDVGVDLPPGARPQVSFKNGQEVPYGTSGSVRPDYCLGNVCSVEVKNYNITTNSNGLINNVSQQAIDRAANLPTGMTQKVVIDVRGQVLTPVQENAIRAGIVQKSNGAISPTSISFKR